MKNPIYSTGVQLTILGLATLPTFAETKPNIVLIMTDQQSYNMMSCDGNKWLSTPNMDKIAVKGYRFEKTYCANPVSMPSRFALFTGHNSSEGGVRENSPFYDKDKIGAIIAESAMGNLFRKGGYETLYSGKLHLYGTKKLEEYGFELNGTDPYDGPAIYAEKALAEMGSSKRDKPFLMVLSFLNPHDICTKLGVEDKGGEEKMEHTEEPSKILARKMLMSPQAYNSQIPPRAKNLSPLTGENQKMVSIFNKSRVEWSNDQWNLYSWMYHRLTESVDAQVGRVLTALEKSGLEENTIIVFTSDHGEMNGAHGLITKGVLYDECQRVPFIFAGKGITPNFVDNSHVSCNGLDLLPTLCDLASIGAPKNLKGISLKPFLMTQGVTPNRKYIVTENYNGYQVTDGQYKFSIYELPGNPETLVDLKANPGETQNFINNPSYSAIKSEMKNFLLADLTQKGLTPLKENRSIEELRKTWKELKAERKGEKKGGKKKDEAGE